METDPDPPEPTSTPKPDPEHPPDLEPVLGDVLARAVGAGVAVEAALVDALDDGGQAEHLKDLVKRPIGDAVAARSTVHYFVYGNARRIENESAMACRPSVVLMMK